MDPACSRSDREDLLKMAQALVCMMEKMAGSCSPKKRSPARRIQKPRQPKKPRRAVVPRKPRRVVKAPMKPPKPTRVSRKRNPFCPPCYVPVPNTFKPRLASQISPHVHDNIKAVTSLVKIVKGPKSKAVATNKEKRSKSKKQSRRSNHVAPYTTPLLNVLMREMTAQGLLEPPNIPGLVSGLSEKIPGPQKKTVTVQRTAQKPAPRKRKHLEAGSSCPMVCVKPAPLMHPTIALVEEEHAEELSKLEPNVNEGKSKKRRGIAEDPKQKVKKVIKKQPRRPRKKSSAVAKHRKAPECE